MGKISRRHNPGSVPTDALAPSVTLAGMFRVIWAVITFPFRLLGWIVDLLGRAVGSVLGFALMVAGVALAAGPFFAIGIPLFVVGLVLLLRSLG